MKTIKCKRCSIIFTINDSTPRRELCNNCQVERMEEHSQNQIRNLKRKNKKLNDLTEEITACIEFTEWEPKLNTERLKKILKPLIDTNYD